MPFSAGQARRCWPGSRLVPGVHMNQLLSKFWCDEGGQDLVEYSLLLAFVCLASAALFIGVGDSILGIWTQANSQLGAANSAAANST